MTEFSERLKELRARKGYSLRDLADICNTSKSAINMYERGERRPKYEVLEALAKAFDVDVDYLVGKTDIPKRRSFKLGKEIYQSISHNIQHHRKEANLSQKQFAVLLGVDESVVIELESGKNALEKEMLYRICDVLQLIPGNIMPRDDAELTEDEEYLLSRRQKETPGELKLTEGEKILLDLFNRVPEDKQQVVLEMIRLALKTQE